MSSAFIIISQYLISELSFDAAIIRDVQYLHSLKRNDTGGTPDISCLELKMIQVISNNSRKFYNVSSDLSPEELCNIISNHCSSYQLEKKKKQMILYLAIVFRNIPQFFSLAKAVLSLSHGNTSSESRSSIIKSVLDTQENFVGEEGIKEEKKEHLSSLQKKPLSKEPIQRV